MDPQPLELESGANRVSALLLLPKEASALLVLGHGAGAGMTHPFLEAVAKALAARNIGTLRYQFPYMEEKRGRPDPPAVLERMVEAAVAAASWIASGRRLYAGGKSMGGRISAQAAAKGRLEGVAGLVFLGFPLHPPKQPGISRAACLAEIAVPMLFLQGTRDALAEIELVRKVLHPLGRAELFEIDGADHSFHVLKRSGRSDEAVLQDLIEKITRFIEAG